MAARQHGAGVGSGGLHLARARSRTDGPWLFDYHRAAHRLASRFIDHDAHDRESPRADGSRAPGPSEGRTPCDRSATR